MIRDARSKTMTGATFWRMSIVILILGLLIHLAGCRCPRCAESDRQVAEVEVLADHINDEPSVHSQYTGVVYELIKRGPAAYEATLALMLCDDEVTRLRAETVLTNISSQRFGFRPGQGWTTPGGRQRFREFWMSLGNMDYKADLAERVRSYLLWRQWIRESRREGIGSDGG